MTVNWLTAGPDLRAGRSRFAPFALAAVLFLAGLARAAEVIPPVPRDHFNDYAGVVGADTARKLNAELTQFERDTSNQLVVAIFPRMQSSSSIEDYTVRVAQAWGVGRKERKNGAVLFIFSQDRKLYIQVGYGLEGALSDARCKQIIENEITPRFRAGDFPGGVAAGTHALIAAAKGEYRGTGRTVRETTGRAVSSSSDSGGFPFLIVIVVIVLLSLSRGRRNRYYDGRRTSTWIDFGSSSSSSWSSGGGGSFSGGGGSFGGGGAGGSW